MVAIETCVNRFFKIRILLIVLKFCCCFLAVTSRLAFELPNDHFNTLGDDNSIISKKLAL